MGPHRLACRPRLWRLSLMVALYKRGDIRLTTSFRLIMVKQQMGLIQECVLATRLAPVVRAALTPGQSGYVRGVEDPHLLLHEVVATALAQG
eukprot:5919973-Karenia_brevis.AAC.1